MNKIGFLIINMWGVVPYGWVMITQNKFMELVLFKLNYMME